MGKLERFGSRVQNDRIQDHLTANNVQKMLKSREEKRLAFWGSIR